MKLPPFVAIVVFAVVSIGAQAPADKAVPVTAAIDLFNGKNLDGWIYEAGGKPGNIAEVCEVKNGVIAIAGLGKSTGYIALPEIRQDYQLHAEWRWSGASVTASTNGGILLNITPGPLQQDLWPISFQMQTKHMRAGDFISMSTAAAAEAAAGQTAMRKNDASEKPPGEWNAADITVRGNTISCVVNGVMQNSITNCVPSSGRIGFQLEGHAFELRNIKLTPLPPATPSSR